MAFNQKVLEQLLIIKAAFKVLTDQTDQVVVFKLRHYSADTSEFVYFEDLFAECECGEDRLTLCEDDYLVVQDVPEFLVETQSLAKVIAQEAEREAEREAEEPA